MRGLAHAFGDQRHAFADRDQVEHVDRLIGLVDDTRLKARLATKVEDVLLGPRKGFLIDGHKRFVLELGEGARFASRESVLFSQSHDGVSGADRFDAKTLLHGRLTKSDKTEVDLSGQDSLYLLGRGGIEDLHDDTRV